MLTELRDQDRRNPYGIHPDEIRPDRYARPPHRAHSRTEQYVRRDDDRKNDGRASGPQPEEAATTNAISQIESTITPAGAVDEIPADEWADTFADARDWVEWNARRRWPDHPANDDIWAMSVTSWYHGGRRTA